MPTAIIDIPEDVDKKVSIFKVQRNDRNKKETIEYIIRTFFEKNMDKI